MANRRMFSKSITNSSRFLMMPLSTQALYFHLGMNADDDGYCEIFTIMRLTEAKPDDFKILAAKQFIHIFDDKVLIILDWKENNYLQKDRYFPSKYKEIYSLDTKCIQNVSMLDTQVSIGKDSIDKDSKDKDTVTQFKENNLNINSDTSKTDSAEGEPSASSSEKRIFLSYVWLSDTEHSTLLASLGEEKTNEYISALDSYIQQIGVQKAKSKYKSHYHTILNWHRKAVKEEQTRIKIMKIRTGQAREDW